MRYRLDTMKSTSLWTVFVVLLGVPWQACRAVPPQARPARRRAQSAGLTPKEQNNAVGGSAGAVSGALQDKPSSIYRQYVQRCLSDKGFEVIGWN